MPHPFRFGVINEQMMSTPQDWIAHVQRIESLGYDTFVLRDHFVPDFFGDSFAPFSALTMAASVTKNLKVGSLVIGNDFRHPAVLAKEAATLDWLSGGRFELRLGAGWLKTEYEQLGFGYDSPGVRISRLAESIQVIKGLWADTPLTFAGQHYQIQNLIGFPKPVQRPHPPILIGGGHQRILQLAGREADIVGILTTDVSTGTLKADPTQRLAEAVTQKVNWIREGAGDRFGEIELSLIPDIIFTNQRQIATENLIRERGWEGISVEQVWEMPAILIGSLEQIVEDLYARRERFGFSYFIVADEDMENTASLVSALRGK
jgi:probable F420-dependent oxidoreductase